MVKRSRTEPTPRRILYLITSDLSARFLRGQLGFLIGRGYEVHVATRFNGPPADFDDGVIVHEIPFARQPSPWADCRALIASARLMRELRPTIVNASTPKAGFIGTLGAWLTGVPKRVYVSRGLRFETATGFKRHTLRAVERVTALCATDVVFNSASLRELAEKERTIRRGRGVVLVGGSGNGIDADLFDDVPDRNMCRRKLGIDERARVVGFVGRLTHDKGVDDLIAAFGDVEGGIVVLLVGDLEAGDPVAPETQYQIRHLEHVHHVPWVPDTRWVYPALDVLVFPSYREGLPNVPLEAQLCGVPVVAYASTGTVDAVLVSSISNALVDVGDTAALRQAALQLLDHAHVDALPREWVRHNFSRDMIWLSLLELYERPHAQ